MKAERRRAHRQGSWPAAPGNEASPVPGPNRKVSLCVQGPARGLCLHSVGLLRLPGQHASLVLSPLPPPLFWVTCRSGCWRLPERVTPWGQMAHTDWPVEPVSLWAWCSLSRPCVRLHGGTFGSCCSTLASQLLRALSPRRGTHAQGPASDTPFAPALGLLPLPGQASQRATRF